MSGCACPVCVLCVSCVYTACVVVMRTASLTSGWLASCLTVCWMPSPRKDSTRLDSLCAAWCLVFGVCFYSVWLLLLLLLLLSPGYLLNNEKGEVVFDDSKVLDVLQVSCGPPRLHTPLLPSSPPGSMAPYAFIPHIHVLLYAVHGTILLLYPVCECGLLSRCVVMCCVVDFPHSLLGHPGLRGCSGRCRVAEHAGRHGQRDSLRAKHRGQSAAQVNGPP